MNGISQNLHRAIVTHSKHAHDDITASLIEHARASLIHERTLKKELEAIRADVQAIGQPIRPGVAVAAAAPQSSMIVPPTADVFSPSSSSYRHPASPAASTSGPQTSPLISDRPGLPGPSTSSPAGPPLVNPIAATARVQDLSNGGRPLDGTRSMIVPPHAAVNSPLSPRSTTNSTPGPSSFDPLSHSAVVGSSTDPLGGGAVAYHNGAAQSSQTLGRSFAQPTRYKIDQREAARKLANFL